MTDKTQLDLFGKHVLIENKETAEDESKRVIIDYDEAVSIIKNNYKEFLNLPVSLRNNKKIKDLALNCAKESSNGVYEYQHYLLAGSWSGFKLSLLTNDDEYMTLEIAKITQDNVVYMQNLSNRLRNDVDFFIKLYKARPKGFDWDYLKYAGQRVTSNKELMKIAVMESASEIEFIDKTLKQDVSFLAQLYKVNEDIIEFLDIETIESKDFLDNLSSRKQTELTNFISIKREKAHIDYDQIKDQLKHIILKHKPRNLQEIFKIFSSMNIFFDYKYNKYADGPKFSSQIEDKKGLMFILKKHYKEINRNPAEVLYREGWIAEPPEWEPGAIEGNAFTQFERNLIEVVEKGETLPEEFYSDENAAPLADGLEGSSIARQALILDVVDIKNPDYGFFAVYENCKIFTEHMGAYVESESKIKSIEGLETLNSYLLRKSKNSNFWFDCEELNLLEEKLPEILWEILNAIFDEVYYSNNFGTLAKVLGANSPDMWQSSLHCLICKKGKCYEIITQEVSV